MRLLVVDKSSLMPWLVRQIVPSWVTVEVAESYDDALRILRLNAPECVVLNVSPSAGPWDQLIGLCDEHDPPIPYLKSATFSPDDSRAPSCSLCGKSRVYEKASSVAVLRNHIACLLEEATQRGGRTGHDSAGARA